ncbi:Protein CBG25203 [Caenorhabditis briggsae]|uniref:Protein CBG25203 n=1 Tax=Caenorhabditis briggsae TaxID=6238 RepID=B6IJG2_CAEBR|nr:Protein CBG25203 [Caenorhabditis briggsae]CAS00042.1 Protein CBG25203 [Caenorhabditis briggsae]
MKRKVTHRTRTAYSDSDVKTEVTEAETPAKKRKITNKRKKAKKSENDSSSIYLTSVIPLGASSMYLERNQSPSLWITLPRADQSQLLDFFLEDELIKILPQRLKVFLTDWLSSAQQKMIEMLKNDDLRKTIESMKVKCQQTIIRSDKRLRFFLRGILKTVFNTQRFAILERKSSWLTFISSFVKNRKLKKEVDEVVLMRVFTSFFYDGELEEEGICNQKSTSEKVVEEHDEKLQRFPFPTHVTSSSTSGTISMDLYSAIPLGAPSMYLERNESLSLWITLTRAEKSQLLKFVLEEDLINDLSKGGKRFLTNWLLSVQQHMIETLKDDGLWKTIESVEIRKEKSLGRCDERLGILLQNLLETVLRTEQFVIFKGVENVCMKYIRNFVQKGPLKRRMNESNLKKTFHSMPPKMAKSKTKVTDPSKKRKPGSPPKRAIFDEFHWNSVEQNFQKFFGPPGYVRPSKKSQQAGRGFAPATPVEKQLCLKNQ